MSQKVLDLEQEIEALKNRNRALMDRVKQAADSDGSSQAVIELNILLQKQIQELTSDLEGTNARLSDLLSEQRLTTDKLIESENRYRLMFEQSKDAMITIAPPSWRFTSANPAMCEMFGVKNNAELSTIEPWHISPEYQPDGSPSMGKALEMIELALNKGAHFFEWTHKRIDGEVFSATVLLTKIETAGEVFLNATVRDITAQKKAEEALRESERIHTALLNNLPGFSYRCRNDRNWTMEFISDGCLQITGYNSDDFINNRRVAYNDIIDQKYQKFVWEQYQNSLPARDRVELEYPIITARGETRWVWERGHGLFSRTGELIFFEGFITDITEKRMAQDKLREIEEFRKRVFESSRIPIIVMDAETYTFLDCNPAAVDIYRFNSRDETFGKNPFDEAAPVQYDGTLSEKKALYYINEALNRGGVVFEWLNRRPDGELWDAEVHLLSFSIEGRKMLQFSLLDITARKRAEERLRASEARYRSIIAVSNTGVWEFHREQKYLWCSPEYFQMLGRYQEEFLMDGTSNLDETWINLIHPDDRPTAAERFANYLNSGSQDMYENFYRMSHSDGSWVWMWSRGQTLREPDGSLSAITVGTHINITEQKRSEAEHSELQTQLAQAQKMESVGRLAGGVAHDFNNMLGVILGHAEMALMQLDPPGPVYKNILEIEKAANRSADLTRRLLAFARRQTVTPASINLNDAITGMLNMLTRLIGEDIDLSWLPGTDLKPVLIDPSQVDQIMANLCVNARDAVSGVGKITIETRNAVFDEAYCSEHHEFIPGSYIMLAVSDDGCGMDKETISKLFEPFFTTKKMGEGTGLGLAMIYGIVRQNEGFINVYSEPSQGSTFRIYLPVHSGKSQMQGQAEQHPESPAGSETILLVEDEPMILNMTWAMLEKAGYTVLAASTPREAIQAALEHPGKISLIITDVVMPEMNGLELAGRILEIYPDLNRLFMSGYTANVIVHHGVLEKGVNFIQKPFPYKELTEKVRQAIDSRKQDT